MSPVWFGHHWRLDLSDYTEKYYNDDTRYQELWKKHVPSNIKPRQWERRAHCTTAPFFVICAACLWVVFSPGAHVPSPSVLERASLTPSQLVTYTPAAMCTNKNLSLMLERQCLLLPVNHSSKWATGINTPYDNGCSINRFPFVIVFFLSAIVIILIYEKSDQYTFSRIFAPLWLLCCLVPVLIAIHYFWLTQAPAKICVPRLYEKVQLQTRLKAQLNLGVYGSTWTKSGMQTECRVPIFSQAELNLLVAQTLLCPGVSIETNYYAVQLAPSDKALGVVNFLRFLFRYVCYVSLWAALYSFLLGPKMIKRHSCSKVQLRKVLEPSISSHQILQLIGHLASDSTKEPAPPAIHPKEYFCSCGCVSSKPNFIN